MTEFHNVLAEGESMRVYTKTDFHMGWTSNDILHHPLKETSYSNLCRSQHTSSVPYSTLEDELVVSSSSRRGSLRSQPRDNFVKLNVKQLFIEGVSSARHI